MALDIRFAGGALAWTSLAFVQDLVLPGPGVTGLLALAVLKEEAGLAFGTARGQWSRGDHLTGLTVGATGVAFALVEELTGGLARGAGGELAAGAFLT